MRRAAAHQSSAKGLDSSMSTPLDLASCATCVDRVRGRGAASAGSSGLQAPLAPRARNHCPPHLAALSRTPPGVVLGGTLQRQHPGPARRWTKSQALGWGAALRPRGRAGQCSESEETSGHAEDCGAAGSEGEEPFCFRSLLKAQCLSPAVVLREGLDNQNWHQLYGEALRRCPALQIRAREPRAPPPALQAPKAWV